MPRQERGVLPRGWHRRTRGHHHAFGGYTRITGFSDLTHSPQLGDLTIDLAGSTVTSIAKLSGMRHLRTLRLELAGSSIWSLIDLSRIDTLESLTLGIDSSQLDLVEDLTKANIRELTLNIENPRNQRRLSSIETLPSLAGLEQSKAFTLSLKPVPQSDLFSPTPDVNRLQ